MHDLWLDSDATAVIYKEAGKHGAVVITATMFPLGFDKTGYPTRDGTGYIYPSPWHYEVARSYGGDFDVAERVVGALMREGKNPLLRERPEEETPQ